MRRRFPRVKLLSFNGGARLRQTPHMPKLTHGKTRRAIVRSIAHQSPLIYQGEYVFQRCEHGRSGVARLNDQIRVLEPLRLTGPAHRAEPFQPVVHGHIDLIAVALDVEQIRRKRRSAHAVTFFRLNVFPVNQTPMTRCQCTRHLEQTQSFLLICRIFDLQDEHIAFGLAEIDSSASAFSRRVRQALFDCRLSCSCVYSLARARPPFRC